MEKLRLACPVCNETIFDDELKNLKSCKICGQEFQNNASWIDLCVSKNPVNISTESAYKIYSKFYAPFAFLAYWIVWRGNILKHIHFFRNIIKKNPFIVDLATGDGSLTSFALFQSKKLQASKIYAIDISEDMLMKAKHKLINKPVTFIRGDACQLPFRNHSIPALSCFGGLNSFPSGEHALQEMARCLRSDGVLRGSILLLPSSPWRKKLVLKWIKKGYQTEEVDSNKFLTWVKNSGLKIFQYERYGDVLLFELRHSIK